MTSQGSASGRFTRAIQQRNVFAAELALKEMGTPTLGIPTHSTPRTWSVVLGAANELLGLLMIASPELLPIAETMAKAVARRVLRRMRQLSLRLRVMLGIQVGTHITLRGDLAMVG